MILGSREHHNLVQRNYCREISREITAAFPERQFEFYIVATEDDLILKVHENNENVIDVRNNMSVINDMVAAIIDNDLHQIKRGCILAD